MNILLVETWTLKRLLLRDQEELRNMALEIGGKEILVIYGRIHSRIVSCSYVEEELMNDESGHLAETSKHSIEGMA